MQRGVIYHRPIFRWLTRNGTGDILDVHTLGRRDIRSDQKAKQGARESVPHEVFQHNERPNRGFTPYFYGTAGKDYQETAKTSGHLTANSPAVNA